MANNNIDQRISYRKGSDKFEQPRYKKLNGSKPPFNLDEWLELLDPGGWRDEDKPNGNNGDKVERSVPPEPYGAETFGWQEYDDYLEKLRPGAIPLSFPRFMDQLDMRSEDYFGKLLKRRKKQEGVMAVVADTSAWHKKYLRNFGYSREYLDRLNRDDLERLFDDIMVRSSRRGRA